MVWWINKHKHSVSVVHIFRVISFKAFCKFLTLKNSAWDFWGVNFWSRDFLGGFVGSPRDFVGFWSPSLEIQSIYSPGGRGRGAYSLACVASVSSRGSSRKLGQERKKKWMTGEGEGEGKEGTACLQTPQFWKTAFAHKRCFWLARCG